MERVEFLVLKSLLHNEDFLRKTIPFIKPEYFQDTNQKIVFEEILDFVNQCNQSPTREVLSIEIEKRTDVNEQSFKELTHVVSCLDDEPQEFEWLCNTTEKWCKERAIYLALMESIQIADGQNDKKVPDAIPSILSDALSVSFDNHVGHDYLNDYEFRWEMYHKKENRIEFDLEFFNKITKGGLVNKSLNIALAGTGVGKSLFMCHMAASCLSDNKNVLYVTLEMAEERIAERIDANLMNVTMDTLKEMPKTSYEKKIGKLREKIKGKLIIKEYPTATASVNNFRSLLNELKIKRGFVPDILFIDYLNLCVSSRYRNNISAGSYFVVKAIAEELRGLAVEEDIPIVSATQLNRTGFMSSDVGLEDTSESFGLPATADFMFALISTEELEKHNQIKVKQLKNRYNDPVKNRNFVVGIDRAKMKLYDVEEDAQKELNTDPQEKPVSKSSGAMSWDKFQKEKNKKSGLESINMS